MATEIGNTNIIFPKILEMCFQVLMSHTAGSLPGCGLAGVLKCVTVFKEPELELPHFFLWLLFYIFSRQGFSVAWA